jgi:AcrR family transcriptional regulator
MGRVAGVTATETRERLLQAAADAFAAQGYDGTRVADIAASAGVSNGALYAHFGSKAELLVGALRAHGRRHLADMFEADPGRPVSEMLLEIGRRLVSKPDAGGYLLVEALVAARRDEAVAKPMRDDMGERADWLAQLIGGAQVAGELDQSVSADALAHFCLLLTMGSALVTPHSPAVDEGEWAQLLTRLIAALAPRDAKTQTTPTQEEEPR